MILACSYAIIVTLKKYPRELSKIAKTIDTHPNLDQKKLEI